MSRIYIVTETKTGLKHLVKAGTQAQAVHHLAKDMLGVTIAKPTEVVDLMTEGVAVLDAGAPKVETPPIDLGGIDLELGKEEVAV